MWSVAEAMLNGCFLYATGVADQYPDHIPNAKELWGVGIVPCPFCDGYEHQNEKIGGALHAASAYVDL
mgnify:CR=1 FL=1